MNNQLLEFIEALCQEIRLEGALNSPLLAAVDRLQNDLEGLARHYAHSAPTGGEPMLALMREAIALHLEALDCLLDQQPDSLPAAVQMAREAADLLSQAEALVGQAQLEEETEQA